LKDFDHDDEIGDRRQEIVIIGKTSSLDESLIRSILDDCLLSNDEFDVYKDIVLGCDDDITEKLIHAFDCPKELVF